MPCQYGKVAPGFTHAQPGLRLLRERDSWNPPPYDWFSFNLSLEPTLAGREPGGSRRQCLLGGALGENPLQRAAVHVEASGRLGDIAAAQFVDALDVLPPPPVGRHRISRRFGLLAVERGERRRSVTPLARVRPTSRPPHPSPPPRPCAFS